MHIFLEENGKNKFLPFPKKRTKSMTRLGLNHGFQRIRLLLPDYVTAFVIARVPLRGKREEGIVAARLLTAQFYVAGSLVAARRPVPR